MRVINGLTIGLTALAFGALAPTAAGAVLPTRDRHVLSVGHVDAVAPQWRDGRLVVRLNDDSGADGAVERDPGDVLMHAAPGSEVQIPEGIDPAFYAVWGPPGSTVWLLPQTQNDDLLWAGWSSETIGSGVFVDDLLTWRLLSVSGPGWLKIFDDSPFGLPQMKLDGAGTLPATTQMRVATHAHFNWLFSARGLYRVRFEVSGTPVGATAPVSSGPVEYRIFVGDLADLPEDPLAPDLSIEGLKGSYDVGEQVALSVVQTPQSDLSHYHWFARCGDASEFGEVGGGAEHTFTVELRHDGCDYRVTLYDETHAALATSPTVKLHVNAPAVVDPPVVAPPVVTPPVVTPPVVTPPVITPPPAEKPGRTVVPVLAKVVVNSVRVAGRRLTVALRLDRRARVSVQVRRGGRVVATGTAGVVRAGRGSVRLRLSRTLGPGRYRVVVNVRSHGRRVTRTVVLRVPAR